MGASVCPTSVVSYLNLPTKVAHTVDRGLQISSTCEDSRGDTQQGSTSRLLVCYFVENFSFGLRFTVGLM